MNDSVTATSWLTPKYLFDEFVVYKDKYLYQEEKKDLIMAYILLHFYLENHFHYYLRFLIGGGFSSLVVEDWNEKMGVKMKLDWFHTHLTSNNFKIDEEDFSLIKEYYQDIADIRNSFAHGHPVTETSESGIKIKSEAKIFLSRQVFNESRLKANTIADLWNKVMREIQEQDSLLRDAKLPDTHFFDNCKFQLF